MAKNSWSKDAHSDTLLGRKQVDYSIFNYGSQIPISYIKALDVANGHHIERGSSKKITLIFGGQNYEATLINVKQRETVRDCYQLRYDVNRKLREEIRHVFSHSASYIEKKLQERGETETKHRIIVPEDQAEYIEFHATGTPFVYEMLAFPYNGSGSIDKQIILTDDVKIIAYFLAKFDTKAYKALGFTSWTKTFNVLAQTLGIKASTLKLTRDIYDSVTDSPRVGYHGYPLTKPDAKIAAEYETYSFDELKTLVFEILSSPHPITSMKPYSPQNFIKDTGCHEEQLQQWLRVINRKKQAIFYGAPGTGKTFIATHLAELLVGDSDGFNDFVQFHPAYTYEDFIQGIRPQSTEDGQIRYPMVPGRFLEFCERAKRRTGTCVLIIDEINRGDLSRVFGELMYLLEYRDQEISLSGGNQFSIPENVIIIGTMNTADRSIAVVDHALRRRFAFLQLRADYAILKRYQSERGLDVQELIRVLESVNRLIGDINHEIGISFFMKDNLKEHLADIWQVEIEPYLEEFFFDQLNKIDEYRWDSIKQKLAPLL